MKKHDYSNNGEWGYCYDEKEVKAKLKEMVEDITWLLDYARRVAQRQVVENDTACLATIRQNLKEIKEVIND